MGGGGGLCWVLVLWCVSLYLSNHLAEEERGESWLFYFHCVVAVCVLWLFIQCIVVFFNSLNYMYIILQKETTKREKKLAVGMTVQCA